MDENSLTQSPETCWIFDIDGVLSNLLEKRITEPGILDELVKRLQKGDIIALNTGRSIAWTIENIIRPLSNAVDKNKLENIFTVAEKGTITAEYINEELIEKIDRRFSIPQNFIDKSKAISDKYSETMFFDNTKKTMITVEMKDGMDVNRFQDDNRKLKEEWQQLIDQSGRNFLLIPNPIATDIQAREVGKALGVDKILAWLNKKGLKPKRFIAVGDDLQDLEMGIELKKKALSFEFIFVGPQKKLQETSIDFPIITTTDNYDKGALEYLKQAS
jgi:hydroxymethylpyrimidine pyrophosphatase-like HAD family hydrolase